MKYYNQNKGTYEELELTEDDLSVKKEVERIFLKRGTLNKDMLSQRVQRYYYNEVGTSSNRLWAVIDYYCEEVINVQIGRSVEKIFGTKH